MGNAEEKKPGTIEDIIARAEKGEKVEASVQLVSRPILEKALAEIGEVEDTEAYLLTGNFRFIVEGQPHEVSKTYVKGYKSESLEARAADLQIANSRLRRDYERLKAAGIDIEEQFFEEFHI